MAQTAQRGDTVRVHYTGTLDDGSVFDSSEGEDPIEFTIGERDVISGLEDAVIGMAAGDKKTSSIPADQAYGAREDELVFVVSRSSIASGVDVAVGDPVRVQLPDGESASMEVRAIDDESITLDANHPLAGQTLNFDLELVSIKTGS